MASAGQELTSVKSDLSEISIDINGKDALAVAASLDLGGLATRHLKRKALSPRESSIMENALRKLKER
jgi:hypothetical protein